MTGAFRSVRILRIRSTRADRPGRRAPTGARSELRFNQESRYGQTDDPRVTAEACAIHRRDPFHRGPVRTGGASAAVSERAGRLRRATTGDPDRPRRALRVHVLGVEREEAGDGLYPAGLFLVAEVSGALPAARDRRQR